jgi:hypothetical protein
VPKVVAVGRGLSPEEDAYHRVSVEALVGLRFAALVTGLTFALRCEIEPLASDRA